MTKYKTFQQVKSLTPRQFEFFAKEFLELMGHKKIYVTKSFGDRGVDVISEFGGEKIYTQCKKWNKGTKKLNTLPVKEVRCLGGCLLRDGINKGIMFTTLEIDSYTRKECANMRIMCIGKSEIIEKLELKDNEEMPLNWYMIGGIIIGILGLIIFQIIS